MASVLLGVTGSVAAIKTPELYQVLRRAGHQVKVVATHPATYFFDPDAIDPLHADPPVRNREVVYLDEDEWPGRAEGRRYQRRDEVRHIELRRWADVFLIAPLAANTLAKLAGIDSRDAATTFGCNPDTMAKHYIGISETDITASVAKKLAELLG